MDTNSLCTDPLTILPIELVIIIFGYLPLLDTWRLRSVSQTWHRMLSAETSLTTAVKRWQTHAPSDRASTHDHLHPSLADNVHRMKAFLSGKPVAVLKIALPELGQGPEYDYRVQQQGRWLAHYAAPHTIALHDLLARTEHIFDTYGEEGFDFRLTENMIIYYATKDRTEGCPTKCSIINLQDFTKHVMPVPPAEGSIAEPRWDLMAASKFCSLHIGYTGQPGGIRAALIFDAENVRVWRWWHRFPWMLGHDARCGYTIDADKRSVTFFDLVNARELSDIALHGHDSRWNLRMAEYSFEGKRKRQVLKAPFANLEFESDIFGTLSSGRPGMAINIVHPCGMPNVYSWEIALSVFPWTRLTLQIDWNSSGGVVQVYHSPLTFRSIVLWKSLVLHHAPSGLYVHRRSGENTLTSGLTDRRLFKPVERAPGFRDHVVPLDDWQGFVLVSINESFLVTIGGSNAHVYVFAFDRLACKIPDVSQSRTDPGSRLIWRSPQGLFRSMKHPERKWWHCRASDDPEEHTTFELKLITF